MGEVEWRRLQHCTVSSARRRSRSVMSRKVLSSPSKELNCCSAAWKSREVIDQDRVSICRTSGGGQGRGESGAQWLRVGEAARR